MIIYVDGSCSACVNPHKFMNSWGAIIIDGDDYTEFFGVTARNIAHDHKNNHELIALVEALKIAKSKNTPFEKITIYTDDEATVRAQSTFRESNFRSGYRDEYMNAVRKVCMRFLNEEDAELVFECMNKSRLIWVKGHAYTVNNLRVDYLAKFARGIEDKFLDFETWISKGFHKHTPQGVGWRWYPPFVISLIEK